METVFGLVGDGFALVVSDTSAVQSIVVQKTDEDKIMLLDSHKLLGCTGESGDRVQFSEFIQKNIQLYRFHNGTPLSTFAAANFTRGELATALRKSPYQVNMMLAGFDKDEGASLYYLDYIATLHKLEKGALGMRLPTGDWISMALYVILRLISIGHYMVQPAAVGFTPSQHADFIKPSQHSGGYFILSLMDKYYQKNMSIEQALELVDKCIGEVRARLVVSPPNFVVKIVDKDGARELVWRKTVEENTGPSEIPPARGTITVEG